MKTTIESRYSHIDPNAIHLMKATINNDGNPCVDCQAKLTPFLH